MYSDKIFKLRKERHITRKALAETLGVSSTAVYKWESGESQPNIETLKKLAEMFGVSMDELLDFTDSSEAGNPDSRIAVMTRAFRQLTPEEQDRLLAVGRAMYGAPFPRMKV